MAQKSFTEQKKRQRLLIGIMVFSVSVTVLVLFFGFFGGISFNTDSDVDVDVPPPSRITIDFAIFDNPLVQALPDPEEPEPFPEEIGRENPFIPY